MKTREEFLEWFNYQSSLSNGDIFPTGTMIYDFLCGPSESELRNELRARMNAIDPLLAAMMENIPSGVGPNPVAASETKAPQGGLSDEELDRIAEEFDDNIKYIPDRAQGFREGFRCCFAFKTLPFVDDSTLEKMAYKEFQHFHNVGDKESAVEGYMKGYRAAQSRNAKRACEIEWPSNKELLAANRKYFNANGGTDVMEYAYYHGQVDLINDMNSRLKGEKE
jgi:hypothetical protein